MDAALARLVWRRARRRCEYCQMPQAYDEAAFEIDHIIAKKHGGRPARRTSVAGRTSGASRAVRPVCRPSDEASLALRLQLPSSRISETGASEVFPQS